MLLFSIILLTQEYSDYHPPIFSKIYKSRYDDDRFGLVVACLSTFKNDVQNNFLFYDSKVLGHDVFGYDLNDQDVRQGKISVGICKTLV